MSIHSAKRPFAKLISYSLISASMFLAGCETMGGLAADAQLALKALNLPDPGVDANQTSNTAPKITRDPLVEYGAFAKAEGALIERIDAQQRKAGLSSLLSQRTVNLRKDGTKANKSVNYQTAGSFRTEIPADAITARHRSVLSFTDSFAEYVARRSQMEPSNLVIVARTQADANWIKDSVKESLGRIGFQLSVTTEVGGNTKPMIGWYSTAKAGRVI